MFAVRKHACGDECSSQGSQSLRPESTRDENTAGGPRTPRRGNSSSNTKVPATAASFQGQEIVCDKQVRGSCHTGHLSRCQNWILGFDLRTNSTVLKASIHQTRKMSWNAPTVKAQRLSGARDRSHLHQGPNNPQWLERPPNAARCTTRSVKRQPAQDKQRSPTDSHGASSGPARITGCATSTAQSKVRKRRAMPWATARLGMPPS